MTGPTHLDCDSVRRQIEAYVEGDLTVVECDGIDRHCNACPACAAVVRGVRQVIELCRDVGTSPLPDRVSGRARDHVKRLLNPRHPLQ